MSVQTHDEPLVVAALYQFVALPDFHELREPLLATMQEAGVRGTLLLAAEGINGTVAGSRAGIDALRAWLAADGRFDALEYKESPAREQPFRRTLVKLRKEIVTLGVEGVDPTRQVGRYVEPADWNALISDPEVLLIDTRNDYEVALGSFEGALDPKTHSFREFPDYVRAHFDPSRHRKVAMFCTGGIRCEKASSFMLGEGFAEVYHLKGGILRYLEEVPAEQSLWRGECFVFDDRVTLGHGLEQGQFGRCAGCGWPLPAAGAECPQCPGASA